MIEIRKKPNVNLYAQRIVKELKKTFKSTFPIIYPSDPIRYGALNQLIELVEVIIHVSRPEATSTN